MTTKADTNCPCCGRAFPKPRKAALEPFVHLADLPDRDVFAYYKRTRPVEDVKFQLSIPSLPAEVRAGYVALLERLEGRSGRPDVHSNREYLRLQQLWREIRHQAARASITRTTRSGWTITRAA